MRASIPASASVTAVVSPITPEPITSASMTSTLASGAVRHLAVAALAAALLAAALGSLFPDLFAVGRAAAIPGAPLRRLNIVPAAVGSDARRTVAHRAT